MFHDVFPFMICWVKLRGWIAIGVLDCDRFAGLLGVLGLFEWIVNPYVVDHVLGMRGQGA